MYRFFTPNKLTSGLPIELTDEEYHHLKKVLRVHMGEKIEIVNGKGDLGIALYDDPIILLSVESLPKPQKINALIQAIPEKTHLEWLIEKGTELGITEFHLFPGEKSKLKEISPSTLSRIDKILISALKQSKRLFLPTLHIHTQVPDLKIKLYLGDPKGSSFVPSHESSAFLIGPESGFTQKEIHFFQTKLNAIPTKLSENILRTETASIIASFLLCTVPMEKS